MAAAAKSESGAPLAAELAAPASPPPAEAFVRIDAEEFARLQAEELAKSETKEQERIALEHSARVARDEQAQREVVDRAWRESQEYARAVAEHKRKASRREARRAPAIAAAILLAAGALGAVLYLLRDTQDLMPGTEASRTPVESRAREEDDRRAGRAADAAAKDAQAKPGIEPEPESGKDLAATARTEEKDRAATARPEAKDRAATARVEEKDLAAAARAEQKDRAATARAEEKDLAAAARSEEKDRAAAARAEEQAKKAAEDKAKALALKSEQDKAKPPAPRSEQEAGKAVDLEADTLAAEERAKAKLAKSAQQVPRTAPRPGTVLQDCLDCPRMVVIAAGEFTMGSLASEAERGGDEGPPHPVSIAYPFALGRNEVTVAEFRRFVEESGYQTEAERDTRAQGCSGFINLDPAANPEPQRITSWRNPGFVQEESHPVLCVSWNDARAYAQWLSKKTGQRYRLPTEAEWEYAARAGTSAARYWGDDPAHACPFANVADQSRFQIWGFGQKHQCNDGNYFTAPAGSYAQNGFGLHDMLGNVWEWTEDCWNASYAGAPADGTAWLTGDCAQRVSRGGSWSTVPRYARSASRNKHAADHRDNLTGFRLARTLE